MRLVSFRRVFLLIIAAAVQSTAYGTCVELLANGDRYDKKRILLSYVEDRDLSATLFVMGKEFMSDLTSVILRKGHVFDAGAGTGIFAFELAIQQGLPPPLQVTKSPEVVEFVEMVRKLPSSSRPVVTAVTARDRVAVISTLLTHDSPYHFKIRDRVDFFTGRLFEDIPSSELTAQFGRVNLIVDTWGVFSYSLDLTTVLRKYHALLSEGGIAYIKVHSDSGKTSILSHMVEIKGEKVGLVEDWLIREVKGFDYQYFPESGVVRLTKNGKNLIIGSLSLIGTDSGLPPYREFRQKD